MTKKQNSLSISPIKNSDRSGDGNIKPETRERIKVSLKEYLESTGRANVSEISEIMDYRDRRLRI